MNTQNRARILLLIPHLGGGGCEQVFALLAQNLPCNKYEVHLGLIAQCSVESSLFPPEVAVHCLGASRIRFAVFRLLKLVRRLNPGLILSGMFHLNFLVLLVRPLFPEPIQVLVRQNGTLSSSLSQDPFPVYTRYLYRLLYRRADGVICQSDAMARDLARETGVAPCRVAALPNPVDVEGIRAELHGQQILYSGPGPHLLAVGRLSREKGFDLLLQALAILRAQLPHADLVIAGSGPEEAVLRHQCRGLGIERAVHFAGQVAQPAAYFSGATAFVLPSRYEAMPNALLEAAAAGLPIAALPASAGIADLLNGQPGTWLAPEISAESLAATLLNGLRQLEFGQRFDHRFLEPFQLKRAIGAYEDLIDGALLKGAR